MVAYQKGYEWLRYAERRNPLRQSTFELGE
jgi:hypothetical protein